MRVLLDLSRRFVGDSRVMRHSVISISRHGYRLCITSDFLNRPFTNQHKAKNLCRDLLLAKSLFRNIDYRSIGNRGMVETFRLIKDKPIENVSFQWLFGFFPLKSIDKRFTYKEFLQNSEEVLSIVSDKIANEEFSVLDGLITPECLSEVKENFVRLSPDQQRLIALELGDNTRSRMAKIYVEPDLTSDSGSESKARIVTVSLITLYQRYLGSGPIKFIGKSYNSEFKRTYRHDVKGPWTISNFNMECFLLKI